MTERGEQRKARAKNHLKVVRERPEHLKVKNKDKRRPKEVEKYDLEVSNEAIRKMMPVLPRGGGDEEDPEPAQAEAMPPLPSESESEEEEPGNQPPHQATNHQEGTKLLDTLHGGAYWPVQEGGGRSRRAPDRLGVQQERGYWEEHLPRELSTEEHGSRQVRSQEEQLSRELSMEEHGSRQVTPQVSPQPTPMTSPRPASTTGSRPPGGGTWMRRRVSGRISCQGS